MGPNERGIESWLRDAVPEAVFPDQAGGGEPADVETLMAIGWLVRQNSRRSPGLAKPLIVTEMEP